MVEGSNATLNGTSGACARQHAESSFDQISWVIAISLAILAAISNNLGVNFQKLAWTKKQRNEQKGKYRVIWLLGMLGIILASVFDFVALAFGPQSVIAPLGALTMVMNGCVAPFMHGEKLRRKIIWTTIIIVAGCAMAVATASHENVICGLDGIFAYFASLTFLGYALVILFISGCVAFFITRAEKCLLQFGEDSKEYARLFKYHRISYAFLAGLFGAQSVVFARAIGQLVMSTTRGEPMFLLRYETWLILLALILMIVIQMIYLNKGLERFESSYNVPVFTGTFIVGTAVSGGVVYGEFNAFSEIQAVLFPLGVCLCVLGVFALAWGNDDDVVSSASDVETDIVGEIPDMPPANPSRHNSVTLTTPRSSLRLASGGFTPFVIGVSDDQPHHIHPHHHHRRNSRTSPHHGRDLLTGLRPEEIPGVFFTGQSAAELKHQRMKGKVASGSFDMEARVGVSPKTSGLGVMDSRPAIHSAPSGGIVVSTITPRQSQLNSSLEHELRRPLTPSDKSPGADV